MGRGVSFEEPYTIQMLKPISAKINSSSINKLLNFQIFQNVLSGKVEASTGLTLAFHQVMDQGVVFGEPKTFQMIQPIMVKTKTGQQDFDQITFMLSHVNQPKQFCKRQIFLKSRKLQLVLPEKLETSTGFTLALLETMG